MAIKNTKMVHRHFILVTSPAQGHLNPTLQLGKRLLRTGTGGHVTLVTTVYGQRRMITPPALDGLSFAFYSDGYDDGPNHTDNFDQIAAKIKRVGSQSFSELLPTLADEHGPMSCIIYSILLPWVAEVARNLCISSALFWNQSATIFTLYYHYFHGYDHLFGGNNNDPSISIDLPGLPLLTFQDLPSFFQPSNPYTFVLPTFQEQFKILEQENKPQVIVNTFDALEEEALRAVEMFTVTGIGPLIPSAFLDASETDTKYGCDLFQSSMDDYMEWLNSKEDSSVVYVSFGTLAVLPKRQMEEIWRGLAESHRPFLWVVPSSDKGTKELEDMVRSWLEEKGEGMIVGWCSQVEVLNHPSVGCFVTHCGWNSTVESLVAGVPVVGCPQVSDQSTNVKLIETVWRTGVRARVNEEVEGGIVESEELKRCLEMVMEGGSGEEIRRNAKKWRDLAKEAVKDGGSSNKNLRGFVEEVV